MHFIHFGLHRACHVDGAYKSIRFFYGLSSSISTKLRKFFSLNSCNSSVCWAFCVVHSNVHLFFPAVLVFYFGISCFYRRKKNIKQICGWEIMQRNNILYSILILILTRCLQWTNIDKLKLPHMDRATYKV